MSSMFEPPALSQVAPSTGVEVERISTLSNGKVDTFDSVKLRPASSKDSDQLAKANGRAATSSQPAATAAAKGSQSAALKSSVSERLSGSVASGLSGALPGVFDSVKQIQASQKPVEDVFLAMTPAPSTARSGGSSGGGGVGAKGASGGVAAGNGGKAPLVTPQLGGVSAIPAPAAAKAKAPKATPAPIPNVPQMITTADAKQFLDRAAAATPRNDAIIAIVDRNGRILGVRLESGVPALIPDAQKLVFAIDGAIAKARTAAFFANDQGPLTSRTVRFISQTTITQREVEANPNSANPLIKGPGFVAPIGLGGHFPPGVQFTPQVDLFAIEHTNRDSLVHPGDNGVRENGVGDDVPLGTRFGADIAAGQEVFAPESYGLVSGAYPEAQSRGIATLPGGVPLYKTNPATKKPELVGGIGVFFPGPDGYATFEQNFIPSNTPGLKKPQTAQDRVNAPLVQQAEYMAVAAAGGVGTIAGIPLPTGYSLVGGRIDLAGITLEIYGSNPKGLSGLLAFGKKLGTGTAVGSVEKPVTTGGDLYIAGQDVDSGWLVNPKAGTNITAAEVQKIILDGVAEANLVRAAIRAPAGQRTKMVLSVTDTNGEVLGLFRMPDATVFSIDVAVAKARNVAYYADPTALQTPDKVDDDNNGVPDVPAGTAFTNRTFRYLSTPFFPTGVDGTRAGDFSILNDPGINKKNAENTGAPTPATSFMSVLGYDSFNPGTNFRELNDSNAVTGNQNGVVFFPGSTPLYKNGQLVGGFGVSGDGVDQDDVVTFVGGGAFVPKPNSTILRADETFVRGIRLPYQKFSRNPHG